MDAARSHRRSLAEELSMNWRLGALLRIYGLAGPETLAVKYEPERVRPLKDAEMLFRALRSALPLAVVYAALALAWSLFGFLSPVAPPPHYHEYSLGQLVQEVGGHILFGAVAALPTLDPALIMLCGAESILIDADHLLPAFNVPVEPRIAHSISFALVVGLLTARAAREGGKGRGVLGVAWAALAAHMSFDVFAGDGFFPLLAPFTLADFPFPFYSWPLLEAMAIGLSFGIRRYSQRRRALQPLNPVGGRPEGETDGQ